MSEDKEVLEVAMIIIDKKFAYEDIDEVIREIRKVKPYLSEVKIIEGVNVAKRLLFKKEYLTNEIKNELKLWDNIDYT